MTAVALVAALVVVWSAVEGFRQGVVRRVVELVGLLVVFVFASRLAELLEPVLRDELGLEGKVGYFASWVAVIIGGVVLVRLAQKMVRFSITGWLDRAGGAVLGAAFGAVIVSCLLVLLLALPVGDDFKRELRDDPLAGGMLHLAPSVYDAVDGLWQGEGFFEMIEEYVEPRVKGAAEKLEATVESLRTGNDAP